MVSYNVASLIHSHFTRLGGRGREGGGGGREGKGGRRERGREEGGRGREGGRMTTHSVVNLSLGLRVTMVTIWFLPPPFVITLFVMGLTAGGEAW